MHLHLNSSIAMSLLVNANIGGMSMLVKDSEIGPTQALRN